MSKHIYRLVSVIVALIVLAATTTSAFAGGGGFPPVVDDQGAEVIKEQYSSSWYYQTGCENRQGTSSWRVHYVYSEGSVNTYLVHADGVDEGINTCTGVTFMKSSWKSVFQFKWDKTTGQTDMSKSFYSGKGMNNGVRYSYRGQYSFHNGQLKLDHYWYNGERLF